MEELLGEIKTKEKVARLLEPATDERNKVTQSVIKTAESFLQSLAEQKAYTKSEGDGLVLSGFQPTEEPHSLKQILSLIENELIPPGLNPASGGHLGYIPGGGIYTAALGDYLAAVTNRYATVFFASPGAVRMENMLIRWLCRMVGYPEKGFGYLASGGSMANLSAIVAARDAKGITSKNINKSVIYFTGQAHHCIDKALRISGLKECIQRTVPMNKAFQMDTDKLKKFIEEDKQKGLNPWLVIATAGTTDVGAVDSLHEIATIAKKYHLWYHIDAAYGGFFLLSPKGKQKLKGISQADSMVLDPHKGLFIPYGSGVVLVKNGEDLFRSFHYEANYMQDAQDPLDEISPAEVSPELSRHFRGLRLWLPLQLYGLKPFRAAIEEKMLLTQYFYREIKKLGFETGAEPELSVMIYRYVPPNIKDNNEAVNTFNKALLASVLQDGRIFISSTTIEGKYWLRIAVLSFRTHLEQVQLLLKILKDNLPAA